MFTARVRIVSLLTLSLLASATSLAYAQELDPDWELQADEQVGGTRAADTSTRDAGAGGSSSHSTSASTGGAGKVSGTREMEGPDMSSCSCRVLGSQRSNSTAFGLLLLAAVGALVRAGTRRT